MSKNICHISANFVMFVKFLVKFLSIFINFLSNFYQIFIKFYQIFLNFVSILCQFFYQIFVKFFGQNCSFWQILSLLSNLVLYKKNWPYCFLPNYIQPHCLVFLVILCQTFVNYIGGATLNLSNFLETFLT